MFDVAHKIIGSNVSVITNKKVITWISTITDTLGMDLIANCSQAVVPTQRNGKPIQAADSD